jgi:hypothetical protein
MGNPHHLGNLSRICFWGDSLRPAFPFSGATTAATLGIERHLFWISSKFGNQPSKFMGFRQEQMNSFMMFDVIYPLVI